MRETPRFGLEERFNASTPASNFQYVEVFFPTANTDVAVEHTLRPVYPDAVNYTVVQATTPVQVYHNGEGRVGGPNTLFLRSNVGNVRVRLLLTLRGNDPDAAVRSVGAVGPFTLPSGVAFPSPAVASSAANVLDTYEEGTWTPILQFGGATTGITYTARSGEYVKIGRQMTFTCYVELSSKGSATGAARVLGQPYTDVAIRAIAPGIMSGVGTPEAPFIALATSAEISLFAGGTTAQFTDAAFTNTTAFYFTCTVITPS